MTKMSLLKPLLTSLFLMLLNIVFAQDCNNIKTQASELEEKLIDSKNPDDYYQYGKFLAQQVSDKNGCLREDKLSSFQQVFDKALKLGQTEAGTRLTLINYFGLYGNRVNKKKAFDYSIETMKQKYFDAEFEKHVWMNGVIFLDYAYKNDIKKYELGVVWRTLSDLNPQLSDKAFNSEKRVLRMLNEIKRDAFTYGHFDQTPNAEKALASAEMNGIEVMYRNYTHLRRSGLQFSTLPNKAQELAMALCYTSSSTFYKDARQYAIEKLKELARSFSSFSSFQKALNTPNGDWNLRTEKMIDEEFNGDIKEMYKSRKTNKFLRK